MTNAGLNVAVLQNIIIDYLVLPDDIEKIISGNFSIYDMNTEALEALSQINFEYFKENYKSTKNWKHLCFYKIDFSQYKIPGYTFLFTQHSQCLFDKSPKHARPKKKRIDDVFFGKNTQIAYQLQIKPKQIQVSMVVEYYDEDLES